MTEEQLLSRYAIALPDRLRISENSRRCYRENPDYRLKAINRVRARRGQPLLSDLSESEALRI
jgi:hypothetical protein